MKLIYRGVTYDYTPDGATAQAPTQTTVSEVHPSYRLRYRGAAYFVDPSKQAERSIFHPIANLVYRGVAYCLN